VRGCGKTNTVPVTYTRDDKGTRITVDISGI